MGWASRFLIGVVAVAVVCSSTVAPAVIRQSKAHRAARVIGTRQVFGVSGTNIACQAFPEAGRAGGISCLLFRHATPEHGSYGFLFDEASVEVVRVTPRGTATVVFRQRRPRPYLTGSLAPVASVSRQYFVLPVGAVVRLAKTDIVCTARNQGAVYHGVRGIGLRGIACLISSSPPVGSNAFPVGNTLVPALGTTVLFVQRISDTGGISVAFFHRQPAT